MMIAQSGGVRKIKYRIVRELTDMARERLAHEAVRPRQTVLRAVPDRVAIEHGSKSLFCRALFRRTGFHFGGARSRRAASDAYYALFHALCYTAADVTIGWSADKSLFEAVYRLLDHNGTANRLKRGELAKMAVPPGTVREFQACLPDLQRLGIILLSLRNLRTTADYDPKPFKVSKGEIAIRIAEADEGIDIIEGLPANVRLVLAVHLIAKPRLS